ncbi:MAG: SDR family NAD(P)-dependent oxidoreductase [Bryobacterales bacterium]|nr:SDR family NAD(P)-dependent oxidoreductase [Bryobacterales bacterium]
MEAFRKRGAAISVCALPDEDLATLHLPEGIVIGGDLTCDNIRRAWIDKTMRKFGRMDVLINNAGVGLYAPPSEAPVDLTRRMFEVNVFAPMCLAQLVIPQMRKQGAGCIVNLGSVGGLVSLPWASMYCATKFAMHALSDSLRREMKGTGVHVVKVCPGIVDTAFREHVLYGQAPGNVSDIRRIVSPQAVAARIVSAVERRTRTVFVPRIGRAFTSMEFVTQGLMDWYLARLNK